MLSDECNAGERWKTTLGLITQKATLHVQHIFLYISLPLFCTNTTWKLLKLLRFIEEMSYVFSFTFFSLPLIFTLHWWPLAFLILSPPLSLEENSNKKCLFHVFFIPRSRSLSPYFSLSFAGLPPTFSFSLSFSCSIFQICGHDNYSELNTLENTDTETISAFRLFSCLCFARRVWLCDFPSK